MDCEHEWLRMQELILEWNLVELGNDKDLPYLFEDSFSWVVMCLSAKGCT